MNVEVKLFAAARQLADAESIAVQLPEGATVRQLRDTLCEQHDQLRDIVPRAMIAIDAEYVNDDTVVAANCEIALIPPVSGG